MGLFLYTLGQISIKPVHSSLKIAFSSKKKLNSNTKYVFHTRYIKARHMQSQLFV